MDPKADYLFEASWEVCNKVGGIFTVVKSKASAMKKNYGNYFMLGPYFEDKADIEHKEIPDFLIEPFETLRSLGINCHYGTWNINGDPDTILLDFKGMHVNASEVKQWLWENFQINSLGASWDFDEPVLWSWACGLLLDKISHHLKDKKIVFHAHEWLSGAGLLYLNKNTDVKTVFTTHATMLGRSIAGAGKNLYDMLETLTPEIAARDLRVEDKFTMERACANNANAFTTVSEITAIEAEKIFNKKPDVLLNNGINTDDYPTIDEAAVMHDRNRESVREFLSYFFFPYYTFELPHNLIYFTLARYEFKNKGLDIIIEALKKLNEELIKNQSARTITMIFWIPISNRGIPQELQESQHHYNHIKSTLKKNSDKIVNQILMDLIGNKCSVEESIFASEYVKKITKELKHFKRPGNPPVCTHELVDQDRDPIVHALLNAGLDNNQRNKVKVIVYPVYLDGDDRLLNLGYYEAIASGHLGLFPSYYEPWGYTPVESMVMSVPAVTTDLAGFGRFIKEKAVMENPGVFVMDRMGKSHQEEIDELYKIMLDFALLDRAERVQNKINAKQLSYLVDWKHFVKNYIKAHNKALKD